MNFGLGPHHIQIINEKLIMPLEALGAKIWIFGSRARGDHQDFSDIDLLIEGTIPSRDLALIKEQLEGSSLPFKVDLVLAQDLADSYRNNINQDKVLWAL